MDIVKIGFYNEFLRRIIRDNILRSLHQGVMSGVERGVRQGLKEGLAEDILQGVRQGIEQGQILGKVDALLTVMRARCLKLRFDTVKRIRACEDVALLDAWIARAAVADTVDEIFD